LPTPSLGGGGAGTPTPNGGSQQPDPPKKNEDPLVVATNLATPVGEAILPDNTALVGERTTGRIVRVQPVAGKPVPTVRILPGVDGTGDGGLLDLALSPSYSEDQLIYAYVTTRTDNRVVAFTLDGPVTPVFTGIPKGRTGNTGRLWFTSSGTLLIGTGDTGKPALAADPASLAGKVLRISDIGKPAAGNPKAGSPIFTTGHRQVDGLCQGAAGAPLFEVEAGTGTTLDEVNVITRGDNYGWPTPSGDSRSRVAELPSAYGTPGDCAVIGDQLYVTSLDGKTLLSAPFTGTGLKVTISRFTTELRGTYGRLKSVVAAQDGALWITTSNKDGKGTPVAKDERVIRYVPDGGGGGGGKPY
ncbi:MAG: PQQ-dependent sugar dehydrogenase, partial [Jatrophihabitans sp.]